jgi:hypothetical protein
MKFKVTWSKANKFEEGNLELSVQGVYLIGYRDISTNKRHPVYVGEGDVGTRLADHYRNNARIKKRLNQSGRVGYYRYAKAENEDDRLDVELALYHRYGGPDLCNEVEPPGSGRYENVEVEESFK